MRTLVALSTAFLLSAPLALAASPKLPAPVTPRGVAGVVPGMTVREVRRQWGITMPAIEISDSSTAYQYGVICARTMVGVAYFVNDYLGALFFFRGAKTDKNVGVGSSLRDLRAAYPQRLQRIPPEDVGFETAYRVYRGPGPVPGQPAIQFNMNSGRVRAVLFGLIDPMGNLSDELYRAHC